ncbi:hypothetical protein [Sphingobium sp. YR657]|uniref:hypothetical protein n=1 Tax=Sphingobium sp. YR657 TaxID=1884366 RepID=UPI0031380DC7
MTRDEALKLAIHHIEHMAAWISQGAAIGAFAGYHFEGLGEDLPGIKAALAGPADKALAWVYRHPNGPRELSWKAGRINDEERRRGWSETPLYAHWEGWRPIETAPKDGWGAPILACRMGEPASWFGHQPVGGYAEPPEATYWNEYGDCWTPCHRPHDEWEPTHWMPFPAAPEIQPEGQAA